MDNTINRDRPQQDEQPPRVAIYDDTKETDGDQRGVSSDTTDVARGVQIDTSASQLASYNQVRDDSSPEELEESIAQTQERIAESIDELTKRLNPARVKDQAVQSLNDSLNLKGLQHMVSDLRGSLSSGAKSSGVRLLEGVKHNPVSAALIGVGAGVIAVGGVMAARTDSTSYSSSSERTYDERLRGMMQTIESSNDNTASVRRNVSQRMTESSNALQSSGKYTVQRAKDGLGHLLESQPLAVGAVALLAGAAIGLLLPRTRYEDSLMGERSDQLISQAKSKASEVVDVAKSTAQDVVQTAKETVGEVVQTAKDTAKETAKAATS